MFLLINDIGYNIYRVFLRCENGFVKKINKYKIEDRYEN